MKKLIIFSILLLLNLEILNAKESKIINKSKINFLKKKYGFKAKKRADLWIKLIESSRNQKTLTKLNNVNSFFNRIRYMKDKVHWKKEDYWATPYELIGTGAGDSEDIAIAKYFTLIDLGIPANTLKLTYVTYKKIKSKYNKKQTVLMYYHKKNGTPIVLDHINTKLHLATKRKDLIAKLSFKESINKRKLSSMIR